MTKKTKKIKRKTDTMSFSLEPDTAQYIRDKAANEGKTQSRIIEEWAQHFINKGV